MRVSPFADFWTATRLGKTVAYSVLEHAFLNEFPAIHTTQPALAARLPRG